MNIEEYVKTILNVINKPRLNSRKYYDGGSYIILDIYMKVPWLHRKDGPALLYSNGLISFHVNNVLYLNTIEYCEAAGMDGEQKLCWFLKYGDCLPTTMDEYNH